MERKSYFPKQESVSYSPPVWDRVRETHVDYKPELQRLSPSEIIAQIPSRLIEPTTLAEAYSRMNQDTQSTQARAVLRRKSQTSFRETGLQKRVWEEVPDSFHKEYPERKPQAKLDTITYSLLEY